MINKKINKYSGSQFLFQPFRYWIFDKNVKQTAESACSKIFEQFLHVQTTNFRSLLYK